MPHSAIFAKPLPFAHKLLGLFVYMATCGTLLHLGNARKSNQFCQAMPHRAIFAKPLPFAHRILGVFVYMAARGILLHLSTTNPIQDKLHFVRSHQVQHQIGSCHQVFPSYHCKPPSSVATWFSEHSAECQALQEGESQGLGVCNSLIHFAIPDCLSQSPGFCVQTSQVHPYIGPTCTDHRLSPHAILAPQWRSYTQMQRLGEADNPGPTIGSFRIAITESLIQPVSTPRVRHTMNCSQNMTLISSLHPKLRPPN